MYGKDVAPGEQGQKSQVAPAGLLLECVHHSSSQRAGAVQCPRFATPEGAEQVGMTAVSKGRPSHMREQLADQEVADAHAMRRGETANVAGEAFRLRSTDSERLEGVQPGSEERRVGKEGRSR